MHKPKVEPSRAATSRGIANEHPYRAWTRGAACAGRSDVFQDRKRSHEALAICARCPVLTDCRGWALHNAVDGVAGGLTITARQRWRRENGVREPRVSVDEFLSIDVNRADFAHRALSADPILQAVARWTNRGDSGSQIAARLGCTRRQVCRLRAVCRDQGLVA